MSLYWWIIIGICIFLLVYILKNNIDPILIQIEQIESLINDDEFKYNYPDIWSKSVSKIIGVKIEPPSIIQIEEYKSQKFWKENKIYESKYNDVIY